MTEQELLDLKQELVELRKSFEQLKGRELTLLEQLKRDYKCKSVVQGRDKIKQWHDERETLDKEIDKGLGELETKYNELMNETEQ